MPDPRGNYFTRTNYLKKTAGWEELLSEMEPEFKTWLEETKVPKNWKGTTQEWWSSTSNVDKYSRYRLFEKRKKTTKKYAPARKGITDFDELLKEEGFKEYLEKRLDEGDVKKIVDDAKLPKDASLRTKYETIRKFKATPGISKINGNQILLGISNNYYDLVKPRQNFLSVDALAKETGYTLKSVKDMLHHGKQPLPDPAERKLYSKRVTGRDFVEKLEEAGIVDAREQIPSARGVAEGKGWKYGKGYGFKPTITNLFFTKPKDEAGWKILRGLKSSKEESKLVKDQLSRASRKGEFYKPLKFQRFIEIFNHLKRTINKDLENMPAAELKRKVLAHPALRDAVEVRTNVKTGEMLRPVKVEAMDPESIRSKLRIEKDHSIPRDFYAKNPKYYDLATKTAKQASLFETPHNLALMERLLNSPVKEQVGKFVAANPDAKDKIKMWDDYFSKRGTRYFAGDTLRGAPIRDWETYTERVVGDWKRQVEGMGYKFEDIMKTKKMGPFGFGANLQGMEWTNAVIKNVQQAYDNAPPEIKRVFEQTMNEEAGRKICRDGCFIKVGKQNPGLLQRTLQKLSGKGGRIGAAIAGLGAVGAGTWAMMGGAEAEETPTTDQMSYNATEGKFVDNKGDPETQEGILNWIGEHPIYSGLAPIPVGMGAGLGAEAMKANNLAKFFTSAKFFLPPAYAAEKIYQYKKGEDLGEMFTNPIDAIWAMALDSPGSAKRKLAYYTGKAAERAGRTIGPVTAAMTEAEKLGLRHLKPSGWRDVPGALKRGAGSPRSFGTSMVFPFAGPAASKNIAMKALRGVGRFLPLGPIPLALITASQVWDKYKFNKEVGGVIDAMRARGVVNEEDAQTMSTIYKQGWLGTTAIGAKLLGSEELMFQGEMLDLDAQKKVLAGFKQHYEDREKTGKEFRADERQEDFFSWFSKGGRVGLAEGGNKPPFSMTRRGFLKWLVGSIAMGVAAVSGKGIKQAVKTATTTTAKTTPTKFIGVEGMPAWFPRAVAKIKTHGKLIEMADKDYVAGDIYEMMIPVKIKRMIRGKPGDHEIVTVQKKVTMSDNPLTGEVSMHWTGTDNFGDDAIREINFKPGQSGYQKFGVDDPKGAAQGVTEYRRVKVEEPEFTYMQPDQSQPYRDDVEYLDIFEEGDEIVKGLEDMTGGKNMVAKDGTVIDVSAEGKGVDEAFQKKIFKDIEGEGQIIPEPEGVGVTKEGNIYGEEGYNEIIEGVIPDHLKKKAGGGRVGFDEAGIVGAPTGMVTEYGREVYETPEGEQVSEKSVTFPMGSMWVNAPSIHGGIAYNEDEVKQMIINGEIQPTSTHGSREEAEEEAEIRSDAMKKSRKGLRGGGMQPIETGNIARRPGAVPPLSGPNPQGTGIVGLFSSPKRVNVG